MKEKCLRVMQGGYNMNIRCNQNFMFYEDRSKDFSVCSENTRDISARYFWGFPLYHPVLLEIPTLLPAGRKNIAF